MKPSISNFPCCNRRRSYAQLIHALKDEVEELEVARKTNQKTAITYILFHMIATIKGVTIPPEDLLTQ